MRLDTSTQELFFEGGITVTTSSLGASTWTLSSPINQTAGGPNTIASGPLTITGSTSPPTTNAFRAAKRSGGQFTLLFNGLDASTVVNFTGNGTNNRYSYSFITDPTDRTQLENLATTGATFNHIVGTNASGSLRLALANSTAIPEPSTFAVLGLGLVGFGAVRYRRRKNASAE